MSSELKEHVPCVKQISDSPASVYKVKHLEYNMEMSGAISPHFEAFSLFWEFLGTQGSIIQRKAANGGRSLKARDKAYLGHMSSSKEKGEHGWFRDDWRRARISFPGSQ